MARTSTTVRELQRTSHRYRWPEQFITFWLIVILACGITQIVVYAMFVQQQNAVGAGTPWLFPYAICVGSLTIVLYLYIQISANNRTLYPRNMLVLSIMFFALYLTGLIECSIQLFGAGSNVNNNCHTYVSGQKVTGKSPYTLAYLEQNGICQGWYASFAFWIVGVVFFIWLFVMAIVVRQNQIDYTRNYAEED